MNIYAIRHLPTTYNKKKLLQGSLDVGNIVIGEKELNKINDNKNKILKRDIVFSKVYTSQYQRAKLTARLYGFEQFEENKLINELNFMQFEGVNKSKFLHEIGENWFSNPFETILKPEIIQLEKNIVSFLNTLNDHDDVLIFSHGAFLRGLKSFLSFGSIEKMNQLEIKNNELTILSNNF